MQTWGRLGVPMFEAQKKVKAVLTLLGTLRIKGIAVALGINYNQKTECLS